MKLCGIIPPLLTPLDESGRLDKDGLEALIDYVLEGGAHGIFILGSTGEGPSLDLQTKKELIYQVGHSIKGRVPFLVGVSSCSTFEAIMLARAGNDAGACAAVVAPPFYYHLDDEELNLFIDLIVKDSPLPILLYNCPQYTKNRFSISLLQRFIDSPRIIGIKDSSGDLSYFHSLVKLTQQKRPDWVLFIGQEQLLFIALLTGATGGIPGGANLFPSLFTSLYTYVLEGELLKARSLHEVILEINEKLYIGPDYTSHIKALKEGLSIKGICRNYVAPPLKKFEEPVRLLIASLLPQFERKILSLLK